MERGIKFNYSGFPKDCNINYKIEYLKSNAIFDKNDGKRFSKIVDIHKLLELYDMPGNEEVKMKNYEDLKNDLQYLNLIYYQQVDKDLENICLSLQGGLKYERLELKKTAKDPLFPKYFSILRDKKFSQIVLANNGWIYTDNPLQDFASPISNVYYLRRVIIWEDCIKLRYGEKPSDCPYLWEKMENYVVSTSKMFHALRIDNAHSTPIHLASYMIDKARRVNPEIYICAELFSGSASRDALFVTQLGIQSLVKEAMHMHSASHFAYELTQTRTNYTKTVHLPNLGVFESINPTNVASIFFDCTHDNDLPNQSKTARDTLPNAVLTAMVHFF